MLNFIELYVKDFMCYSESVIDFTKFNSALILGRRSNDFRVSNGTGKSTIFKAINYVLFDEYPSSNINKIVRDGKQIAIVSVKININDKYYKITRKRSIISNASELMIEASVDNITYKPADCRTTKQSKEFLSSLLKISFTSWKNSVFFSQSGIKGLADATPSERKLLLKEPLNLAVYSKYEKLAKKKLEKSQQELDFQLKQISTKDSLLEKLLSNNEQLDKTNSLLETTESSLSSFKNKKEELNNELSSLTILNNPFKDQFESKSKELSSLKVINNSLKKSLDDYNLKLSNDVKLKNSIDISKYQKIVDEYIDKVIDESKIDSYDESIIKANTFIAKCKSDIAKYSKPLPVGSSCDSCHQELSSEYRDNISHSHDSLLKESKSELEKSISKLEKIKEKKTSLIKEIKLNQENKNNYNLAKSKLESLNSQLLMIENNINNYNTKIQSISLDLQKSNQDCKKALQEYNDLETQYKKEEEKRNTNKVDILKESLDKISKQIKLLESEVKECIQKIGYIKSSNDSTNDNLKKIELIEENIKELQELNSANKSLVKAFSNNGIPSLIINTILDDLQIEANSILRKIRPELEVSFIIEKEEKDTLDMSFLVNGQPREYDVLSGGQRVFVSFALQLGLSIVIQKRLGVEINLLLLDEVDQPFDGEGKDAFVNMVKILQKDFKIMVITHNDRIKDKFDNVIIVDQENDVSTIKVV